MIASLCHDKNWNGAQAYQNVCIRCQGTQHGVDGFAFLCEPLWMLWNAHSKSHKVCTAYQPGSVDLALVLQKTWFYTTRWGKMYSRGVSNQSELDWYCSSQKSCLPLLSPLCGIAAWERTEAAAPCPQSIKSGFFHLCHSISLYLKLASLAWLFNWLLWPHYYYPVIKWAN